MSADDERFERAVARIDDANAADPSVLLARGKAEPKELVHSRMLTEWVRRLRPDASEALLLAARAHHIRRWVVPRESYPKGRRGYLQWRTRLHGFHAEQVAQILRGVGYPDETVARVGQIIRKQRILEGRRLKRRPFATVERRGAAGRYAGFTLSNSTRG